MASEMTEEDKGTRPAAPAAAAIFRYEGDPRSIGRHAEASAKCGTFKCIRVDDFALVLGHVSHVPSP